MTRRYKAFISYSWADRTWGEWLHRTLETYRAPKGVADGQSLHPIFKDREEEAAGGSVGAAIEAALAASEFLIVICSPRSARSAWVNREVAWFKTHKDKGRILALIVDGEPGAAAKPGRENEECFPKTLTHKVGADLQPTEEWEDAPLAADARPEGDGRRGAKLKLAAALLGVGLDALVRRDERRRTIRRRLVTSAAFGLAAALGGLALYAFSQRDAAVIARNDAVKARDDAEGLIELILTDLKSDLEGFGTLKSVTAIGNRAIGYYEGQDIKALTPDQLGRRARVLLMLGEADNKRGDLSAALARYETAAATTQEQLARDPDNPQRMFDHAQSVFWVGYIAWQRGDRAMAKRQFTEYHDIAQRLVAKDPANEDWQAELDYAYSNLGTLAMDDGDPAAAEGYFGKSLDLALARLSKSPGDGALVYSAGQAYAWLADAKFMNREFVAAKVLRDSEISLYESSVVDEANATFQVVNAVSNSKLAEIELTLGDPASSRRRASLAVDVLTTLQAKHPENLDYAELSVIAAVRLAVAHFHLSDPKAASAALHAARRTMGSALAASSNATESLSISAAWIRYVQGLILEAEGRRAEAEDEFVAAAEASMRSLKSNEKSALLLKIHGGALAGIARGKDHDPSRWRNIVSMLERHSATLDADGELLLASAYERLADTQRALQIAAPLASSGYRHPDFMRSGLYKASIERTEDRRASER